jgi:PilZ domain-containing protein
MRCASQLKRSANVDSGSYELVVWVSQRLVDFNSRFCLSELHSLAQSGSVLASALLKNFSGPDSKTLALFLRELRRLPPYPGGTPMPRQWLRAWRGSRGLGDSRQQRQRIERYFDCTWLSVWGEQSSRVSSLSPTGCYVDSRFTVPAEGTVVRDITLALATGTLTLQGTVIATMRGVGFAVRFTELDEDTRDRLSALIYSVRQATR